MALWLSPSPLPAACLSGRECRVGAVVEYAGPENAVASVLLTASSIDGQAVTPFRLRLITTDAILRPGAEVSFRAALKPDTANYYSLSERITATAYAPAHTISIVGQRSGLSYKLLRIRQRLEEIIEGSALSPQAGGLLSAACLGTGEAPADIRRAFRLTALAHLLCVSGLHVSIVAWLISLLLLPLRVLEGNRRRYLLLITLVWLFVGITGLQASAVRAAIMLTIFYIGRMTGRSAGGYNSLLLAVAAVLCFNPYWLWSPGFQMSVSAVLGLIAFARALNPIPHEYRRLRAVGMLFTVPFAATVGTLPVVMVWFGRVALLSVPVNAAATLIFPVFMVAGMLSVVAGQTLPGLWAAKIADGCCAALMRLCDAATDADMAIEHIHADATSVIAVTAIIVAAAILLNSRQRHHRLNAATALLLALTTLLLSHP
ncbi:MAG: ComEC/Rec2 family competence protein [Muribaculaceae bacterium]|nr:ComEC/Rec2 family competence protein [Muribaculaceae bacterium]